MEVFNCEQGTEEWFKCRMGIPTASMFSTVLAKGRGGAESKTRRTYMMKLIGEKLTGEPQESFSTAHMERGNLMEPEARSAYEFMHEVTCEQVGFMREGDKGASPDSLVEADGLMEIKTKLPHLQLEVILKDEVPSEHIHQIQGQLWIAEREWCDFVSYWPKLPLFVKRIYRDDDFINKTLWPAVDKFNSDLNDLMEKFK